jgi:hypothetical protein
MRLPDYGFTVKVSSTIRPMVAIQCIINYNHEPRGIYPSVVCEIVSKHCYRLPQMGSKTGQVSGIDCDACDKEIWNN